MSKKTSPFAPVKLLLSLIPAVLFGGLALYFFVFNDMTGGIFDADLGPTVLGVSAMAIFFAIGPIFKLIQFSAKATTAKETSRAKVTEMHGYDDDIKATAEFDADAIMQRYLEKKHQASATDVQESSESENTVFAAPRTQGFGRKGL